MTILNVAYSCNEVYIEHTGISILSLLENNKEEFDLINIYFIGKNVTTSSINKLKDIALVYNAKLIYLDFDVLCSELNINALGRHIETVYSKLFFCDILNIDKILYVDSDTIINASLSDFWNVELDNYVVAGVSTPTIGSKKQLCLSESDTFINDGVVLMNLKKLREENYKGKFLECIASYGGDPPVLSEGVINKVCQGKIKIVNPEFYLMSGLITYKHSKFNGVRNFYSKQELQNAIKNPVIIHYLAGFYNRPWNKDCKHPMKDKFLYYKSKTIWKDVELKSSNLPKRIKLIGWLYKYLPADLVESIRNIKNYAKK